MRIMIVLACIFASAWGVAEHDTTQQRDTSVNDMPLGVDDAGATTPIWKDEAAKEAFRTIGFDFLSFHLYPATSQEDLRALDKWAEEAGVTYLLNQECADRRPGAPDVYPRAGTFYQPDFATLEPCLGSPRFLGMVYDELDHCVTNGGWPKVTRSEYAPYF